MRKMTKTVAVLAAMSAMTVASASLACAATPQLDNVSAVSDNKEAAASAAVVGSWSQDKAGKWSFTKEKDGKKLKNTWAKIDGVWYYFDGEIMAQDKFLTIDEKDYFFDDNGRLASGWQKITTKMDAYGDIDITAKLYYPESNSYTQVDENHEYDYHDYVWCYFDDHGVAKENEWFQDTDGKWYYFDGNVMVKNVYDYEINPDNYDVTTSSKKKLYGFDENGAMLVGWNSKTIPNKTWNGPTLDSDGKVWYYYKSNGQMQTEGWAQIGDDWYLFANLDADGGDDNGKNTKEWHYGGYPLIVNSYVASYNKANGKAEYFYMDKNGKLAKGVQSLKNVWKVVFYDSNKNVDVAFEKITTEKDKEIKVNFGSKGAATEGVVDNSSYYTLEAGQIRTVSLGDTGYSKILDATAAFDNYKTIKAFDWKFTDMGSTQTTDANNPETVKESADYYDNVTFSNCGTSIPNPLPAGMTSANYFKIADITVAQKAVNDAATAYTKKTQAETAMKAAKGAWNTALNNITINGTGANAIVPTGYATDISADVLSDIQTATKYAALSDESATATGVRKDTLDAMKLAKEILTNAKKLNQGVAAAQAAYDNAKKDYDAVVKACNSVSEAVTYAALQIPTGTTTIYQDWKNKEDAYNKALASYESYKKAALKYDYSYFVNKWDDAAFTDETDFAVVGELVKNSIIGRASTKDVYVADKNGNFVTNKAILIDTNANITHSDGKVYNNAFIVLGGDGKAAKGYEGTKKSITIGGLTYWATGESVPVGDAKATVFVVNRDLQ